MAEMKCDFCGKTRAEVRHLITGPAVAICDDCVIIAFEILMYEAKGYRMTFNLEKKRDCGGESCGN